MKFDDVFVLGHLLEEDDFPICPLGVDFVLKGPKDLFEGKYVIIGFVLDFPDYAVGSLAFDFENLVASEDVAFDVFVE